jgi:hypothetical protein
MSGTQTNILNTAGISILAQMPILKGLSIDTSKRFLGMFSLVLWEGDV